jgi:putative sigma-54 modulation protein
MMQLNITGHHVEVSPALRAYATEKMQRLSRHFDHVISIDVILKVEKLDQIAEVTVNAGGRTLFATHTATDLYASIDGMADKIDRQVRRLKAKLRNRHHVKPDRAASNA